MGLSSTVPRFRQGTTCLETFNPPSKSDQMASSDPMPISPTPREGSMERPCRGTASSSSRIRSQAFIPRHALPLSPPPDAEKGGEPRCAVVAAHDPATRSTPNPVARPTGCLIRPQSSGSFRPLHRPPASTRPTPLPTTFSNPSAQAQAIGASFLPNKTQSTQHVQKIQ
jgi:hypothetical protein